MTRAVTCFYHPDVIASTKCERCYRPICLNDLRKYRKEHHGSFRNSDIHVHFFESRDLCLPCYCDRVEKDYSLLSRVGLLFFAVFLAFFVSVGILLLSIMLESFSGFSGTILPFAILPVIFLLAFTGIPLIILLFILYHVFIESPRKVREARTLKKEFLASLPTTTMTTTLALTPLDVSCFQCGTPLQISDKFCPNCGDPTIEEQNALKNV